jgi:glyoxylase-like metal-dependent hydrolase (beta-lactamase superfamily II)
MYCELRAAGRESVRASLGVLIWRTLAAGPTLLIAALLASLPAVGQTLPPVKPVQVSPHAWFVQGQSALGSPGNGNFISNAGFVVTGDSVVVIDALGSPALARELLRQIRRITAKPVSHVLLTHYHADHVYGLQVFKEAGATIVAERHGLEYLNSDAAQLRLQASRTDLAPWIDAQTRLMPADRWIDGDLDLAIGGTRFQLRRVGPSHTEDDLAIFLPDERVLFAGDLVFRGRVPYVGQADSKHWIAALEQLLALDAAVIVPGHGPESRQPREDITLTRDYLAYLRKTMGEAARNMDPFDEAYARTDWSRFKGLPLFDAANRMNAYNTYLLMEQEK